MFLLKRKTDEEIVQHVLAGRREAFGVLVERYLPVVYGLALARTGNRADADDSTQEAFLKAFTSLDQLRDAKKFGPWLISIARNVCGQLGRMTRREAAFAARLAVDGIVAPPNLERDEMQRILWDEIQELDEASRDILVLHYRAGKSSKEIAALLEISDDAVRKRLQRAREALSERLLPVLHREEDASRKTYRDQARRIMGVVLLTPTPWTPVVPAAWTLAGAVQALGGGLSAPKLTVLALAAVIGLGILVGRHTGETSAGIDLSRQSSAPGVTADTDAAPPERELALAAMLERVRGASPASRGKAESSGAQPPAVALVKPESGPGAIHGVVVYPDGRPAIGATVNLLRGTKQEYEDGRLLPVYEGDPPNGVWKTTRTDLKGRFSFANLPLIDYCVIAQSKDGLILRTTSGARAATPTSMDKSLTLELRPAMPLAGVVVDGQGAPVVGATVFPYQQGNEIAPSKPLYPVWQRGLGVITDDQGRFRFESLQLHRWKLLVTAPGLASTLTEFVEVGRTDVRITLWPGGSVSGKVLMTETGLPVGGALVRVSPVGWYFDTHTAVTGADGYFSITGLRAGEWTADLDHALLISLEGPAAFTIGGETDQAEITIAATMGAVLAGNVRAAADRKPLKDVQVVAWTAPDEAGICRPRFSVPTDAEGSFTVAGLRPGTYTLELRRGVEKLPLAEPAKAITLGPDDYSRLDSEILAAVEPAKSSLTGVVNDAQGRPVACAVVCADVGGQTAHVAYTDNRGRFELPGSLAAGATLYARKDDYLASRCVNIDAIDFHQEITLDLEPASSMEGRLLDLAGRPLLSGKKKAIVTAVPVAPANAPSPSVLTGIEGWFRLTGLTAGTYDIYIETQHKEDAYPPRTRITQIEVAPGRDVLARDLVYGHADKELTIAGLVTTKDGRPVGDARVNAEGSVRRETVTDANGRFILRGLDPNRYQVIARSSLGGVGMATDVEAGRHDLTIRLGGMGKIEGRVIDGASGNPVSEFEVSVGDKPYFEPGQTVEGQTTLWVRDDRGRFQVKYIPMGSAVLAVRAPGYAPTTRTINPVADNNDAADVVVRLDRGGEIRGRALEGDKPLVGQRVWVQAGNFGFSTRTNSRGYYALANLPPGPCFLNFSIHKPGDVRRSILRRATVVTGKSVTVDLSVRSADAALAGLVTFDGALPSRAHLHVSVETPGGETEQFYADVNPDGTYYLETVPVGLATVQAVAASPEGDQRSQTATMKTVSGAVMRQDFNFTEALNVSGRVHGLRPNEYAVLVASEGEWPESAFTSTDAFRDLQPHHVANVVCNPDGAYKLSLGKPGTYTLAAMATPRQQNVSDAAPRCVVATVTVAPDTQTRVDLTLP